MAFSFSLEKERSKSYHLFEKESVVKKTIRNANNVLQHSIVPPNQSNIIKEALQINTKKEDNLVSFQVEQSSPQIKPMIKDLRRDMLFIPKNMFEEPAQSNPNLSFVTFNELHKKQPKLFPVLNYVSSKELQAEEEKKRRDESMSALDRFFKDMRRDSQRGSIFSTSRYITLRDLGQVRKELLHNDSQKKMYDQMMEKIKFSLNEKLWDKCQEKNKRMPTVRAYSMHNEGTNRLKKAAATIIKKGKQDNIRVLNYMDSYSSSKLSFFKYENAMGAKPMASEGATLSVYENKAFIIGGRGVNFRSEINLFKLDKKKWKTLIPKTTSPANDKSSLIRANHSSVVYKNTIVVFGGEKEYNVNMKARQCLSNVEIYNIAENTWNTLFCKGETPEARKNHVAVLIGNQIFVHGGTNSFSKCLKDACILDLWKSHWTSCDGILDLPALSYHTAILVSENEKKYISMFFPRVETRQNNTFYWIKEEGIYMFGGKNHNNQANNNLIIIKPGGTPFRVLHPEVKGEPPEPRYSHTMKFLRYLNCIVVYGGRNDELNCCFSDIFALNLQNLIWCKLNPFESKYNECKCSFGSDLYKTRMLIFGGINFSGFIDNDLYVIEFDDNSKKRRSLEQNPEISIESLVPNKTIFQRNLGKVLKTYMPVPSTENKSP